MQTNFCPARRCSRTGTVITSRVLVVAGLVASLLLATSCAEDDPATPPAVTKGTIIVTMDPDEVAASWLCTPLGGQSVAGQDDSVMVNMAPGTYELVWGDWEGCATPEPDTLTLAAGDSITFAHIYLCFPPPPPVNPWLFGISGNNTGDVYAGGMAGALFRYDGSVWSCIASGTTAAIVEIWTDDDGTVWACGHDGLVMTLAGATATLYDVGSDVNLYTIGRHGGGLYIGGQDGALMREDGGVWSPVAGAMILRDPDFGTPTDTLQVGSNIAAFTTISDRFIGGAYHLPDWQGDQIGIQGTDGMILTADTEFDWWLQPVGGNVSADPEWILCSTSDPVETGDNWLGTSEGWLFQLQGDDGGRLEWLKYPVHLTDDPGSGIRDLWLADGGHLYLVTDDGKIIYLPPGGGHVVLHDQPQPLVSIWGTGPDEFFVTGYMEAEILRCTHDPGSGDFQTELIDVSGIWP